MMDAIPWYRSPVFVGAAVTILSTLISLFPRLGTLLGIHTSDDTAALVNSLFGVIALLAGLFTAAKRKASTVQPITLTKTGAEQHPQTLANKAAVSDTTTTNGSQPPPPTK